MFDEFFGNRNGKSFGVIETEYNIIFKGRWNVAGASGRHNNTIVNTPKRILTKYQFR